jgi:hypothetical protein
MIQIKAIQLEANPMRIVPGSKTRQWMDETPNKFAYRCLPLQIANTFGWDIYPNCNFMINWTGEISNDTLHAHYEEDGYHFVSSPFGSGIFTMHSGYMFRTDPDWDLLVCGPVNDDRIDWATPLVGVVETSWLSFTFTVNWKLHKAGTYTWPKDVPIARIVPVPHKYEVETEMVMLYDEPEVADEYKIWCEDRDQGTRDLKEAYAIQGKAGSVEFGKPSTEWEKNYYCGVDKYGTKIQHHITKRNFPEFIED